MLNVMLWAVIMMIGFSIHYKIYKIRPGAAVMGETMQPKAKINKNQWITIAGICVMVYLVMVQRIDVGLASFFVSAVLILLGVSNEKQAIGKIPWGTLLLILSLIHIYR